MSTVAKSSRSTTGTISVATAGPLSVGFRLYDADTLNVYVNDLPVSNWTLTFDPSGGYDDAATITFDAELEAADTYRIEGAMVPDRADDLVNGGPNLLTALNQELPRIWAVLSEHAREISRTLRGFAAVAPSTAVADLTDVATAVVDAEAAQAGAEAAQTAAEAAQAAAEAAENSLLEWAGAWLTATAYAPSDIVTESGNAYICIVAHTSGTFATDLSGGKWELFVSKGASGAGSGDVVASNEGSEFTPGAFRANLQVPGRFSASVGTNDFDSDYDSRETSLFQVPSTPLNGPTGGVAGDWVLWFRVDSNNIRAVWFLNDGTIATRTKVSGTWGSWVPHYTKAGVDSAISTALAGVEAGGWDYYDGDDGVIYSFADDGASNSIVTPDFEDGYEYRLEIRSISPTQSTSELRVQTYLATTGAYETAFVLSGMANSNTDSAIVDIITPRVSKRAQFMRANVVRVSGSGSVTALQGNGTYHGTAQKRSKARITLSVGNTDSGVVVMLRRPSI